MNAPHITNLSFICSLQFGKTAYPTQDMSGNRSLFVAHKAKTEAITDYLDKEMTLVGYKGVVIEDINVKVLGSFPRADGETGSLLLAIKSVDMSDYKPIQLTEFPVQTETTLELLSYKMYDVELPVESDGKLATTWG